MGPQARTARPSLGSREGGRDTRARIAYPGEMRHGLPLACTVLAALSGSACRPQETTAVSFAHVDSQGGGELTIGGVRWTFDGSVHFLYHHTSATGRPTETVMTVDGQPFGMRGDVAFVGDREYGRAPQGSTVAVTSAGVTVDGEARGPLPD